MALSAEQLLQESMTFSTADQYTKLVKNKNKPQVLDQLPGGGSVGWLGSKNAKRVLGYLPGGALVLNADSLWMSKVYDLYLAGSETDVDFAVAILAYGKYTVLTAPYPAQFRQTCAFVEYLLNDRDPANVDLGGESSGAALILGFCLHIHHPHPKIPPFTKLKDNQSLGRLLLCSPLGPVRTASVVLSKYNEGGDLNEGLLARAWETIAATKEADVEMIGPWLTPSWIMYEDWYTTLPVGEITIISGRKDILREDIDRLSNVLRVNHHHPVHIYVDEETNHLPYVREREEGSPLTEYTKKKIQWVKKEI